MNNNIAFCLSFFIILGLVIMIYAVRSKSEFMPKGRVAVGIVGLLFFTFGIVMFANYDVIFGNVKKDSELFYESASDSICRDSIDAVRIPLGKIPRLFN